MFPVVGTFLMIVGLLLMSRIGLSTGGWTIAGYLFVFGVGLGLVMQVLVVAVQNAVPYEQLGTATSGATFFRMIGGSFGTAVFGAIFANLLATNVAHCPAPEVRSTQSQQLTERCGPDARSAGCPRPSMPEWWRAWCTPSRPCSSSPCPSPRWRSRCRGSSPTSSCARTVRTADPGKELGMHESRSSLEEIQLALERLSRRENRRELYTTLAERAGLQLDARACWLLYRFADRPDCTLQSVASRLKVDPERIEEGIESLVQARMVTMSNGPGECEFTLTEQGHHAIDRLRAARRVGLTELLEGWDPETHPEIGDMVRRSGPRAAGRRREAAGRRQARPLGARLGLTRGVGSRWIPSGPHRCR